MTPTGSSPLRSTAAASSRPTGIGRPLGTPPPHTPGHNPTLRRTPSPTTPATADATPTDADTADTDTAAARTAAAAEDAPAARTAAAAEDAPAARTAAAAEDAAAAAAAAAEDDNPSPAPQADAGPDAAAPAPDDADGDAAPDTGDGDPRSGATPVADVDAENNGTGQDGTDDDGTGRDGTSAVRGEAVGDEEVPDVEESAGGERAGAGDGEATGDAADVDAAQGDDTDDAPGDATGTDDGGDEVSDEATGTSAVTGEDAAPAASGDASAADAADESDEKSGPGADPDSMQLALSAIETARSAAADGDAAGTIRALRSMPERLLLDDDETFSGVTELVAVAARAAGFDDLAATADVARSQPTDPHALYGYGYSCVERGVAYLAVPALTRALARAPEADTVRMELVSALEAEARNADAVRALAGSSAMEHWTGRYLLVFNCLMAGDLDGARQWFTRLGKPEDRRQETMLNRLTAMLARVQLLTGTELLDDAQGTPEDPYAPLGSADLRGWHFALNAGVLTTLSPYGADAGMNGRYAYLAETYSSCHWALHRLKIALEAADRLPPTLGLLPDRSSRIMGIAMAELLGVQAWDWRPQTEGALVIAHSFADAAPHVLSGLSTARGQLIVEHATCWTDPPPIAADGTSLLQQVVVPPWGSRRLPSQESNRWIDEPADDRPEREIAAEILNAPAVPDPGDGSAPPDTDDDLGYFVARIAPLWARTEGHRDRVWSPGPVHSSRFW